MDRVTGTARGQIRRAAAALGAGGPLGALPALPALPVLPVLPALMVLVALLVLGAAAAPPAPARAADWATFGFDATRAGDNELEAGLGGASLGGLAQRWSVDLGAVSNTQPLVISGVSTRGVRRDLVLAGSENGRLVALDAATGALIWRRDLGAQRTRCPEVPHGTYGVTGTPVVDRARGAVYAAGGDDRVYALDLASGATMRGWPAGIGAKRRTEHVWSALTLSRGLVYVATASYCDRSYYRGKLIAIDARTARRVAAWYPTSRHGHGGGIWGWGGAAVDPRNGDLYVATANAQLPLPERFGYAEQVVRLTSRLTVEAADRPPIPARKDSDFGAAPLLYDPPGCPPALAVAHKSGRLLVYDRDAIGRGPRQQLQIGSEASLSSFGTYAYGRAQGSLFVANPSDSAGAYKRGLLAFGVGPDCRLALRWQSGAGRGAGGTLPSPPVTANGVVYVAIGDRPGISAWDAASGRQLWGSASVIRGPVYAAPAVANGWLYVTSWDRHVHAFH